MASHYDTLGVKPTSTQDEIRSAYRRLVLRYHPDRAEEPGAADVFIKITAAYEVLGDKAKRFEYDRWLKAEEARKQAAAQSPKPQAKPKPGPAPSQPKTYAPPTKQPAAAPANVAADVTRLTLLFSRNRYSEAETLARNILGRDQRQAIPYGILGDIARSKGNFLEAAKMYAYAAQMDPRNPIYQRRHEELLSVTQVNTSTSRIADNSPAEALPMVFGVGIVLIAALYVVLAAEAPLLPGLKLVSSWTLGLVGMLFFSGVAVGASLSLSALVDRFQSIAVTSMGRMSPTVALGFIAVVNFWAAAVLYVLIGLALRGFNYSTTRVVGSVAVIVLAMTLAAGMSRTLEGMQVLVWGGNIIYIGALGGWMVADAFRR